MPFLGPGRGLVRGDDYVDVATQQRSMFEGRGLIRTERVRKRFIYPRRYWGNPVNPTISGGPTITTYPYQGGGFYPS